MRISRFRAGYDWTQLSQSTCYCDGCALYFRARTRIRDFEFFVFNLESISTYTHETRGRCSKSFILAGMNEGSSPSLVRSGFVGISGFLGMNVCSCMRERSGFVGESE